MIRTTKTVVVIGMLLALLWIPGCSTATPIAEPTADLNAVRTEAAATVLAQVTQAAALTPSATFTPSPTATFEPTGTPTMSISATPSITGTLTAVTATIALNNQAAWVAQSIPDGTAFLPAETFTITWTIRNVGESTWTPNYLLRFFSGDRFGAASEYPIGQAVAPNETIEISIPMTAPSSPGEYRTDWVLSNEQRSNFKEPVFLKFSVSGTPTPTLTAIPTVTPTP